MPGPPKAGWGASPGGEASSALLGGCRAPWVSGQEAPPALDRAWAVGGAGLGGLCVPDRDLEAQREALGCLSPTCRRTPGIEGASPHFSRDGRQPCLSALWRSCPRGPEAVTANHLKVIRKPLMGEIPLPCSCILRSGFLSVKTFLQAELGGGGAPEAAPLQPGAHRGRLPSARPAGLHTAGGPAQAGADPDPTRPGPSALCAPQPAPRWAD